MAALSLFLWSFWAEIGWVFSIDMYLKTHDIHIPKIVWHVWCLTPAFLDLPPVLLASHHSMQQVTTKDVWSTLLAWDVQANWRDGKITTFLKMGSYTLED